MTVRHVVVESDRWRGPPLRIGLISDTHVTSPHVDARRVRRVVEQMNAERPDVVVLLGDYVGGHLPSHVRSAAERDQILAGLTAFGQLSARYGVFGVQGNHDSWFDELSTADALERANVVVLENRATVIERADGSFWIAGLADLYSRRHTASVDAALADVPQDAPALLLTHWPDPFDEVPSRVALTLAGHTHCGQVNLPVLGRLIHASAGSARWQCGLYQEGGRQIFVTGGVGVSILPVRFRAPPEIVILTLRSPTLASGVAPH
ncbi:metallophosphoesterase [Brevundimonas sp.]|uniref:metallophosphoesterase n=1 Tax=Brevundimonas sp. TaxID=1871086 RepID=UPI0025D1F47D|nr:metallophosphoesterase [Brevundimonas sp.]